MEIDLLARIGHKYCPLDASKGDFLIFWFKWGRYLWCEGSFERFLGSVWFCWKKL